MRLIKLALISAFVLFGLITLMSSLLPSHIRISRAIDINTTSNKISTEIADIRQWERWNEYIRACHNRKYEDNSLQADKIIVTVNIITDSLVASQWQYPSGDKFGSGFAMIAQDSNHTTVQWYFDFHLNWYPWEKFQSIIYDQQLGPVMEKSLANLKKITENND
jgi:hypothetical protein